MVGVYMYMLMQCRHFPLMLTALIQIHLCHSRSKGKGRWQFARARVYMENGFDATNYELQVLLHLP